MNNPSHVTSLVLLESDTNVLMERVAFDAKEIALKVTSNDHSRYDFNHMYLQINRTPEVEEVLTGKRPIRDIYHYRLGRELSFSSDYSEMLSGKKLIINFMEAEYTSGIRFDSHAEVTYLKRLPFDRTVKMFSLNLKNILTVLFGYGIEDDYLLPIVVPSNLASQYEMHIIHTSLRESSNGSVDTFVYSPLSKIFGTALQELYEEGIPTNSIEHVFFDKRKTTK